MSLRFNNLAETVKHSFGMWINGLWGNMLFDNRGWNFCEQKGAFFILLRRLLDEERVVLFPPDEFWQRGKSRAPCCSLEGHENIWAIPPVAMLTHIKKYWPVKTPQDINQLTLDSFLRGKTCPQIAQIAPETKQIIPNYNGLWELWERVMGELFIEHRIKCQEVFLNRLGQLLAEGKVQLFPPTSLSTLSDGIRAHSRLISH